MAAFGSFETFLGPIAAHSAGFVNASAITQAMTAANNGWAAVFTAYDTRDIKSAHVYFTATSSPGTMEARIETIDTAGEPTGTLYDAAATKTFTPATGWNTITFDTLPTTGLVAGTSYALVLLKADAATTCTLYSYTPHKMGALPGRILDASDISTRSNFAIRAGQVPICYFTLEDDAVEALGCCPCATSASGLALYGADRVMAQKIVLPVPVVVRGIVTSDNGTYFYIGTPAGGLRVRILDASNNTISGSEVTIPPGLLASANSRGLHIPLPNVSLAAGTYRIAFDSPSSANSSNCHQFKYGITNSSALVSSAYTYSESTDASTTFTWTDTGSRILTIGLLVDSFGSTGGFKTHPGMTGGING